METHLIEIAGYAGTAATVATYSMKRLLALRITAIFSSVFFITYTGYLGIWPLLLTELVILPINSLRLWELLRERRAEGTAPDG